MVDSVACNEGFFEYLLIWVFFKWTSCNFPRIPGVRELKSSRYHKTQKCKNFCQK